MSLDIGRSLGAPLPAHLHGPLLERGFACASGIYRANGLTFRADRRWLVLAHEMSGPAAQSCVCDLGRPGLWKSAPFETPPARVFELPVWAVKEHVDDSRFEGSVTAAFAEVLDWALATHLGALPSVWKAPEMDLVQSWLARGALTVAAKGQVSQSELLLTAKRWTLRLPIVPHVDPDLPAPRRRTLGDLAKEAQRRWAMVRVALAADSDPPAMVAEVDLSGAPHSELLFSAGLDVLRHVYAWLAETAAVLADRSITITSLAPGGSNNPEERKHTP